MLHIITPEYPPQLGGVADYTELLAGALRAAGCAATVWCPALPDGTKRQSDGVRELPSLYTFASLRHLDRALSAFPAPRRLLVQWVPHGYGYRSMNLPFCLWLWRRALQGDRVEIMLHEPFLQFREGNLRQDAAAVVHRLMTLILLRAASKVWTASPTWARMWKPYTMGKPVPFVWLPIPSNVPQVATPDTTHALRRTYLPEGGWLLGHFGTYPTKLSEILESLVPLVLRSSDRSLLLMGKYSDRFRLRLLERYPTLAGRIHATGACNRLDLSTAIAATDLMIQPYSDGVTARRSSLLAVLSHGIPTVTNDGPMTEEFWRNCDSIELVPRPEAAGLAAAVDRLLADPERRRQLGERAAALYHSHFDFSATVNALREAAPEAACCV